MELTEKELSLCEKKALAFLKMVLWTQGIATKQYQINNCNGECSSMCQGTCTGYCEGTCVGSCGGGCVGSANSDL